MHMHLIQANPHTNPTVPSLYTQRNRPTSKQDDKWCRKPAQCISVNAQEARVPTMFNYNIS